MSTAAPDVSFPRMMQLQESLAKVILSDQDVASVASFIGSDGTNATTNTGRLTITLKAHGDRKSSANEIIARLEPEVAKVEGITLFMQSVQDLNIDNRVSQTQYQYTMEDANPLELRRS